MGNHPTRSCWPTLFGVCLGMFAVFLDSTVVSLALTEIRRDLGTNVAELRWVMNIYLLVLAVAVVTLGRLGDIFGRRRFFVAGCLIFAGGSVMSAVAPSPDLLIAERWLPGKAAVAGDQIKPASGTDAKRCGHLPLHHV